MLSLKGVIDNNNGHEEDVLELKQGLQQLGYYKTPKYGMTGYTDDETFEGVKRFQKDNDLTVDGVLKPGGETESKLNEHLNRRKTFEAPRTAASASAAESDDSMNRLHEKYKDTLVRRNLLTTNKPLSARKNIQHSFNDIYSSEYDNKGNLIYKGTDMFEGGYSNRKEDRGGRTNFGITQRYLDEYNNWNHSYRSNYNMPKNVENLTQEQAKTILNDNTYKRYGINKILDKNLARQIFDQAVNLGAPSVIPVLQREINKIKKTNLPGTNIIGKQTQDALNSMTDEELNLLKQQMAKNRLEKYFDLVQKDSSQKANLKGWVERGCHYLDNKKECVSYLQRVKEILNK